MRAGAGGELHLMAKAASRRTPHGHALRAPARRAEQRHRRPRGDRVLRHVVGRRQRRCRSGRSITVDILSGTAAADAATLVSDAINDQSDWPVTAAVATATITISAKTKGTRGNNITCGSERHRDRADDHPRRGRDALRNGAGSDTITTALATIAHHTYDRIARAFDDATTIGTVGRRSGRRQGRPSARASRRSSARATRTRTPWRSPRSQRVADAVRLALQRRRHAGRGRSGRGRLARRTPRASTARTVRGAVRRHHPGPAPAADRGRLADVHGDDERSTTA